MEDQKRTTKEKIRLYASFFQGLKTAYGTYDPVTGRYWQVKKPVKRKTIYDHLRGGKPYGFYPLVGSNTRVGVVDFDNGDPLPPIRFIERAKHYDISAYLERSKSKGYHVWLFFPKEGVSAIKARLVINHILKEIESPDTEVFPKQDYLNGKGNYGNFINAPLFGKLVPDGKTIFITPDASLYPFPDQWAFLESIARIDEKLLDDIIALNELKNIAVSNNDIEDYGKKGRPGYSLPACIQSILRNGVEFDQRVATFRIAVHLKRIGLPEDCTVAALLEWKRKNKPINNKLTITTREIHEQVEWAYKKVYTGYGCQDSIIQAFCDPKCPVNIHD